MESFLNLSTFESLVRQRSGSDCGRLLVVATLLAGLTLSYPPCAIAYVEGPPPGNTGGFGEQSCLQCHFDGPLNDPDGSLRLEGVPESYVPGDEYRIDIVLVRSDIRRGGFELAVRFRDGPEAGQQAGVLIPIDSSVDIVRGPSRSVQYARQNDLGSSSETEDSFTWSVQWQAPPGSGGPVAINVAANAANDDASELGDWIYVGEAMIPER